MSEEVKAVQEEAVNNEPVVEVTEETKETTPAPAPAKKKRGRPKKDASAPAKGKKTKTAPKTVKKAEPKKTVAKKTTAKKETAEKTGAKRGRKPKEETVLVNAEIVIRGQSSETTPKALLEKVKEVYAKDITSLKAYIDIENLRVNYIVNDEVNISMSLF